MIVDSDSVAAHTFIWSLLPNLQVCALANIISLMFCFQPRRTLHFHVRLYLVSFYFPSHASYFFFPSLCRLWGKQNLKERWNLIKALFMQRVSAGLMKSVCVLRPGQVWQLCLQLKCATLTTRQPGKVRPYRVSERWDDDVSLSCLHFSPLDFVVFLLCVGVNFFAHLLGTWLPSELDGEAVNPLCTCDRAAQTFHFCFTDV